MIGAVLLICLLAVTGYVAVIRNSQVALYMWRLHKQVQRAIKEDESMAQQHGNYGRLTEVMQWRYRCLMAVPYPLMLFSFRPLDSFFPDKSFLRPTGFRPDGAHT